LAVSMKLPPWSKKWSRMEKDVGLSHSPSRPDIASPKFMVPRHNGDTKMDAEGASCRCRARSETADLVAILGAVCLDEIGYDSLGGSAKERQRKIFNFYLCFVSPPEVAVCYPSLWAPMLESGYIMVGLSAEEACTGLARMDPNDNQGMLTCSLFYLVLLVSTGIPRHDLQISPCLHLIGHRMAIGVWKEARNTSGQCEMYHHHNDLHTSPSHARDLVPVYPSTVPTLQTLHVGWSQILHDPTYPGKLMPLDHSVNDSESYGARKVVVGLTFTFFGETLGSL